MSTTHKNLSQYRQDDLPDVSQRTFGIVVSEWNEDITEALFEGAYDTLLEYGALPEHIFRYNVPGGFELSLGAQYMATEKNIDAVICLGCVIKGETRHDEYIANAVAQGITDVSLKFNKPVIFGLLTTNNHEQAFERAGGRHGNKGDEAALTAIKMLRPVLAS